MGTVAAEPGTLATASAPATSVTRTSKCASRSISPASQPGDPAASVQGLRLSSGATPSISRPAAATTVIASYCLSVSPGRGPILCWWRHGIPVMTLFNLIA